METQTRAKEIETKIIPLTIELAKHFKRMKTLKGDRDPDTPKGRARQAILYDLLRAGLFYSPEWSYVKLLPNTKKGKITEIRVNGGNSSNMLVSTGIDFPEGMSVTIRVFEAKSMEEVIELYEQFDAIVSTRTTNELIKNKKAYIPDLENIPPSNVRCVINGIRCHLALRNPWEEYKLLDLVGSHSTFISWCAEFFCDRKLRKPGVIGAIYATYIHDPANSLKFWRMVKDETGLSPDCPTRTLSRFLHDEITKTNQQKIKWSSRAYYSKCHHAWNAWKRGETTTLKYHKKAKLPELSN